MKKLLALLSFIFVCFLSITVKANPGDTCANPIVLPQNDTTCLNDSLAPGAARWYTVMANGKSITVTTVSLTGSPNVIFTISIYDSCSGAPIATDTITSPSQDTLVLNDTNLVDSNNYYIKITADSTDLYKYVGYQMCVVNIGVVQMNPLPIGFDTNLCGLNYVASTVQMNQRQEGGTGPNLAQPVTIPAPVVPPGAKIIKAFLWFTAVGGVNYNTGAVSGQFTSNTNTYTITPTPIGIVNNPTCWNIPGYAFQYTISYFTDVTSQVTAPGSGAPYIINGFPVNPGQFNTANGFDIDGATLMLVYQDSCSYQAARLTIWQGLDEQPGNTPTQYVQGIPICETPLTLGAGSNAFDIIADVQNASTNTWVYAAPPLAVDPANTKDMYSLTTFPQADLLINVTGINFWINNPNNDCYDATVFGLYTQGSTPCDSCTQLTVSITPDTVCTYRTATITAVVNGGIPGYTYLWTPTGATTSSITVGAGSYTVTVKDANGCSVKDSVLVANYPIVTTLAPDTLCSPACDTLKEHVYFGQTYSWSPATGLSCTNCPDPVACPTVTTTYTVTATNSAGCMASATAEVVIGAPPVISISATATSVCQGTSVTLCASGATSYVWSNGATTNCITVTPLATITYKVVGSSGTGCTDSASITITVLPNPVANAGSNDTICTGTCDTIGVGPAQPNVTYTWSPASGVACDTCLVTIACPTVTTTYTLVAKNKTGPPYCTDTATVTIVVKTPVPPAISGEAYGCDSNALYTVTNVQPGDTYYWTAPLGIPSSGTGTSATINFYSSGGTIYWSDSSKYGCVATDSLVVHPCCTDTGSSVITVANGKASVVFPANSIAASVLSKDIYVNGTLTFDKSVSFTGCDFKMGQNAQIIIDNGDTMQLNDNICNHLHAGCGAMWSGIHILAGGYFISEVNGGNLIEDADTAIDAENTLTQQATFQINNKTYLNNNYIGVLIRPFSGTYTGYIHQSVISCRNFSALPRAKGIPLCFYNPFNWKNYPMDSLMAPNAGIRGNIGVFVDNVNHFTENGGNVYDNLDNGIYSGFSNLKVQRDTFEHVNSANLGYAAINAVGGDIFGFPPDILVVGGNTNAANYFTDCTNGVYAYYGYTNVTVTYNKFYFNVLATNLPSQTRAIWLYNTGISSTNIATITNNTISKAYTGIECDVNTHINATISGNTITEYPLCPPSPTMVGIILSEVSKPTSAYYNVVSNNISSVNNGIFANSVYGATINGNTIGLVQPYGLPCPPVIGYGIQVNNSQNCSVKTNTISTGYINNNQQFTGIEVASSPLTVVCSNNLTGMRYGINFGGSMGLGCTCVSNALNWASQPNAEGIMLTSSAIIGQQGNMGQPSDNTWTSGYPCRSYCIYLPGASIFYIRKGSIIYSPLLGCPPVDTVQTTGTTYPCNPPLAAPATFSPIATDSISFTSYPDTTKAMAKQGLTSILWRHKALLADTSLSNFNDSIQKTAMGQLLAADTLLSDTTGLVSPALLTTVNSISPTSNLETNMQKVAALYLTSVLKQHDTLSPSQLAKLRILANKCPYLDGSAVYDARALLVAYDGVQVYDDSCAPHKRKEKEAERRMNQNKNQQNISVNIFPNPNNGSFIIEYQLNAGQTGKVVLYSTTGVVVGQYNLNNSTGKMSIANSNLSNGVYIYKLYTSDNTMVVGKVIIIK